MMENNGKTNEFVYRDSCANSDSSDKFGQSMTNKHHETYLADNIKHTPLFNREECIKWDSQKSHPDESESFHNEALDHGEKKLSVFLDEISIVSSPPMSLNEMDNGRISPIQVQDVCHVNSILNKSVLECKVKYTEANDSGLKEMLKYDPSNDSLNHSASHYLWNHSKGSLDGCTRSANLAKLYTKTPHCEGHCTAMEDKFGMTSESDIINEAEMSQIHKNLWCMKPKPENRCLLKYQDVLNKGFNKFTNDSRVWFWQGDSQMVVSNNRETNISDQMMGCKDISNSEIAENMVNDKVMLAYRGETLSNLSWTRGNAKSTTITGQYTAKLVLETRENVHIKSQVTEQKNNEAEFYHCKKSTSQDATDIRGKVAQNRVSEEETYNEAFENLNAPTKSEYFRTIHTDPEKKYESWTMGRDHIRTGLWKSIKKVNLPDYSSYVRVLGSRESNMPVVLNKNARFGSEKLQKNNILLMSQNSNVRRSEDLIMTEKLICSEQNTDTNSPVITSTSIEEQPFQICLLEPSVAKQAEGFSFKWNSKDSGKTRRMESGENTECVIQIGRNMFEKQDEPKRRVTEENCSLGSKFLLDRNIQDNFSKKSENMDLKPWRNRIIGMPQLKIENCRLNRNCDPIREDNNLHEVSQEFVCGKAKAEGMVTQEETIKTNICNEIEKIGKNDSEVDVMEEENLFEQVIDKIVDEAIARKDGELVLKGDECVMELEQLPKIKTGNEMKMGQELKEKENIIEGSLKESLNVEVDIDKEYNKTFVEAQVPHQELMEICINEEKDDTKIENILTQDENIKTKICDEIEDRIKNDSEVDVMEEENLFEQVIDKIVDEAIARKDGELVLKGDECVMELEQLPKIKTGNEMKMVQELKEKEKIIEGSLKESLNVEVDIDKEYNKTFVEAQVPHQELMEICINEEKDDTKIENVLTQDENIKTKICDEIEDRIKNDSEVDVMEEENLFEQVIDKIVDEAIARKDGELVLKGDVCVMELELLPRVEIDGEIALVHETKSKDVNDKESVEVSHKEFLNVEVGSDKEYNTNIMKAQIQLELMEVCLKEDRKSQEQAAETQKACQEIKDVFDPTQTFIKNAAIEIPVIKSCRVIDTENVGLINVDKRVQGPDKHVISDDLTEPFFNECNFEPYVLIDASKENFSTGMQVECEEKEDICRVDELEIVNSDLKETIASLPLGGRDITNMEASDVKEVNILLGKKDKQLVAGKSISENEGRVKITLDDNVSSSEGVAFDINSNTYSDVTEKENHSEYRGITTIPSPEAVVGSIGNSSLKDVTDKIEEVNNCLHSGKTGSEEDISKLIILLNKGSVGNNEETVENSFTGIMKRKELGNCGDLTLEENLSCLTQSKAIEYENCFIEGDNMDNCTSGKKNFRYLSESSYGAAESVYEMEIQKQYKNASKIVDEVIVVKVTENSDESKEENQEVNCSYVNQFKSNDKTKNKKEDQCVIDTNSLNLKETIKDDVHISDGELTQKSIEYNAKDSVKQAMIMPSLDCDLELLKPGNLPEVANAECNCETCTSSPMRNHQHLFPFEKYWAERPLNDTRNEDASESCHDSEFITSCSALEAKTIAIENIDHTDYNIIEGHDMEEAVELLNHSTDITTLNQSAYLEKPCNSEAVSLEQIHKDVGRWYASQNKKDYMISGIEVSRTGPINDFKCLNIEKKMYNALETNSRGPTIVEVITKKAEESLKPESDLTSFGFGEMLKTHDAQPCSSWLHEVTDEDEQTVGKFDYKKLSPDSAHESEFILKSQSHLKMGRANNRPEIHGLCEISDFDNDLEVEKQSNKFSDKVDMPTLTTNDSEEKHYNINLLENSTADSSGNYSKYEYSKSCYSDDLMDVCEHNSVCVNNCEVNSLLEEKYTEYRPNYTYEKIDSSLEDLNASKQHETKEHVNTDVGKQMLSDEITMFPEHGCGDYEKIVKKKESRISNQVVPDVPDVLTLRRNDIESCSSTTHKRELFSESAEESNSSTKRKLIDIDAESDSFSLDSYLETVLEKQLSVNNNLGAKKSCITYSSQFATVGCQTKLCGLLNVVHSCKCLETHLITAGDGKTFQIEKRKRAFQALDLESLALKSKKMKMIDEIISADIDERCDDIVRTKCGSNNKCSSEFSIQGQEIPEKILDNSRNELTLKKSAKIPTLTDEEWEDLNEDPVKQEQADQKVPEVRFQQDFIGGPGEKSQKWKETTEVEENVDSWKVPSLSNTHQRSSVLRLGLSKKANLPRLHNSTYFV